MKIGPLLSKLTAIQSAIRESFDLDVTPVTEEEIRAVCERHAGNGIHSCHQNCQRIACVQRRKLKQWEDAVLNLKNVQGRHNTKIAMERLFALLEENKNNGKQ